MPLFGKDAGIWKQSRNVYAKDLGIWKRLAQLFAKALGVWKPVLSVPPVILGVSSGGSAVRISTTTVTLPAGVATGDLLLLVFNTEDNNAGALTISGWTRLTLVSDNNGARPRIYYRVAAGGEASVAVFHGNNDCSWYCYRIGGYDGIPEVASALFGNTTAPNPVGISPTWGTADAALYIAWIAYPERVTVTAYPSGYANGVNVDNLLTSDAFVALATLSAYSSSGADPGAFALSGSGSRGIGGTIAIKAS